MLLENNINAPHTNYHRGSQLLFVFLPMVLIYHGPKRNWAISSKPYKEKAFKNVYLYLTRENFW